SLLCQRPDHDGKLGLVGQRVTPRSVNLPFSEIRFHTGSIAPALGLNAIDGESTLRQEVLEAGFRPTGAVVHAPMDAEQEGYGNEQVAPGAQHLVNVFARAVGPQ